MTGQTHIPSLAACVVVALLSLLTPSCTNEDLADGADTTGTAGGCISFGVSSRTASRAGASGAVLATDSLLLRSDDAADSLAVLATVTEGIGGTASASRAAGVTEANFYENFRVLAYRTFNGTLETSFFMDEDVFAKPGNLWRSEKDYYWSGTDAEQLQFLAWAPSAAFTRPADSTGKLLAGYTVPQNVAEQKDVVVAMTDPIGGAAGNAAEAVPLNFKHLCTAVRFVVGKEIQAGTIKSVSLRGVKSTGSYDMASDEWKLGEATADFSQALNKEVFGTMGEGASITTEAQTFMMLPQTLPAGASLEVVFYDADRKEDRTFKATIAGTEWPKGATVTYKIAISPEYEFILTETPTLDAHYDMLSTTLKVSGVPDGKGWTITAPTLDGENVSIILQSGLNQYAKQGYWTDRNIEATTTGNQNDKGSARGEAEFKGTGSGEFPITIFVPENKGEAERSIDLAVRLDGSSTDFTTIQLSQYAPSWNGNIGCERIEENESPWGMYWSQDYEVIYDMTNCPREERESLHRYLVLTGNSFFRFILSLFGYNLPDLSFVEEETSGNWWEGTVTDKVTIKLGDFGTSGIALSPDDGAANTMEVYNYKGFAVVIDLINRLESIPGYQVSTKGEGVNPAINASLECVKLNSCNIVTAQGEQLIIFDSDAVKWYLPARNEAPLMQDSEYPLSGTYWTSTAVNDNQNAYIWSSGQASADGMALRKESYKVRAVRAKP